MRTIRTKDGVAYMGGKPEFHNPYPTPEDLALFDLEQMPLDIRAKILNVVEAE